MTKDKRIIPTLGYNHLEPGAPGNVKLYRICGAHTRNELTVNELCQRPAGWGTNHPGVGRCKLHGGAVPMRPDRYSSLWRGRMKEIAAAHLEADQADDPLDLLAELEVQRVLLSVMIDQLARSNDPKDRSSAQVPGPAGSVQRSGQLSDQPGNALEEEPGRSSAIRPGATAVEAAIREEYFRPPIMSQRRRRMGLDVSGVGVGMGGIGKIMDGSVSVDDELTEFSTSDAEDNVTIDDSEVHLDRALMEQIQKQLEGITNTVTRIVAQRNQTAITKAEVTYLVMMLKEGMERFVPKENREPYVRWIMENIPGARKVVDDG